MRKTYKEKYLELEIEKKYLLDIIDNRSTEILCQLRRYKDLSQEFYNFKLDLKKKEEKNQKLSFIICLIGLGIISVFGLLSVILGSLGLL